MGPVYSGSPRDPELLAACYRRSLDLAAEHGLQSIAFLAISTGVYGYPLPQAARVALSTVLDEIRRHPGLELVRFVLWGEEALRAHEEALRELFGQRGPG